ncbi:TPA: DUF4189 domain-containing protein [Stenotrophomonas maltophilia]|nr:DUF4189 domain-containing protein [Stenotrophomonas maltophilia]HED4874365.1 DUF4189 domain-containing protein [Stenotrophomonas maltophilia]
MHSSPGAGPSAPRKNSGCRVETSDAVATSLSGDAGSAASSQARASAEGRVLELCAQSGAIDCRVVLSYHNQRYAAVDA